MSEYPAPPLAITVEQVQRIIQKHVGLSEGSNARLKVTKLEEIRDYGYSSTSGSKIYIVDLNGGDAGAHGKETTASCFLTISTPPPPSNASTPAPSSPSATPSVHPRNTLPLIWHLLSLIRASTNIPISDSILDTTHELVPFDFLLSPPTPFPSSAIITLRDAKASGLLDAQTEALINLQLGTFLAQLHQNVQNDWYGRPTLPTAARLQAPKATTPQPPPPEAEPECYSWQETFTGLLSTLLASLATPADPAQPRLISEETVQAIHTAMSRAIAFFLFDDVEVPSLVWFTGSDTDIYLSLPGHPSTKTPGVAAILPSMPHMIWGDPLLESFFLPLADGGDACKALVEGYTGAGGTKPIIFPRQKTKRVWYTLYLALSVLHECVASGEDPQVSDKIKWAQETIQASAERLKTAPCY